MSYAKPASVSCKYGAPMGRASYNHTGDETTKVMVSHMPLDSGGYDAGGAYWGRPSDLYWVRSRDNDSLQAFYRARSRREACAMARADYPNIIFARRP